MEIISTKLSRLQIELLEHQAAKEEGTAEVLKEGGIGSIVHLGFKTRTTLEMLLALITTAFTTTTNLNRDPPLQ